MNRFLIMVFLLNSIAFVCQAQITDTTSSKFDIANFEKHQTDNYSFTLNNGDNVQQVGDRRMGYVERLEKKSSPYGYYKEFFPNGELKTDGPTFYGYMIGIHKHYNRHGVLINSVNLDKGFTFTIDDLVKKVDDLYHINLLDRSLRCNVVRSNNSSTPIYNVSIPDGTMKDIRDIEINGINGQILSDALTKMAIKPTE